MIAIPLCCDLARFASSASVTFAAKVAMFLDNLEQDRARLIQAVLIKCS